MEEKSLVLQFSLLLPCLLKMLMVQGFAYSQDLCPQDTFALPSLQFLSTVTPAVLHQPNQRGLGSPLYVHCDLAPESSPT